MAPRHASQNAQRLLSRLVLCLVVKSSFGQTAESSSSSQEPACTLASLVLSSHGRPVDLVPSFRPTVYSYSATLDFSMWSFSVNVRPDLGCEDDGVPGSPTEVEIGGSTTVRLYALHPDTGAKQTYDVEVSRLLGSETELQEVSVIGGELNPIFDPSVRSYAVRLGLAYDTAVIKYRPADNEQRIRATAQEEQPAVKSEASSTSGNSSAEVSNSSRRLAADMPVEGTGEVSDSRRLTSDVLLEGTGEVQYREASSSFMLDIGFSRTAELTVQCADATQAAIGTYTFSINRPSCPDNTPYFEPKMRRCVNFCPSGSYRNDNAKRCAHCNTNCEVCSGLLECDMCTPNTAEYSYVIMPDGKCQTEVNHIFKRYRWWCLGFGVLLAFLVCIGCVGICHCLWSGPASKSGGPRLYDSDTEDELPKHLKGRRLGMY